MSGDQPSLAALRADLDRIDDGLHDALMRRAEVVAAVAASGAKRGIALRPGREAAILRRLVARHAGPMSAHVPVRVWREILAGSTAMQGKLVIAVCADGAEGADLVCAAREHFGALTPLRVHRTPAQALADVSGGAATAALLPLPSEEEGPRAAWWLALLQKDEPRISVVAKLPVWATRPEGVSRARGFVVATSVPDPSGDDRALLGIELPREVSRARLASAMTEAGLAPLAMLVRRDAQGPVAHALIEVAGLVADDDPRLAALGAVADRPVVVLGGYAVPMEGS